MPNLSNFIENALLNAVLRNTTYTSPATVYAALYTVAPQNEVQQLAITGNPTGGTFTVTFGGQTSAAIAFNATAAAVQSALQAMSSIGNGGALVYAAAPAGALPLAGDIVPQSGQLPGQALYVVFTGTNGLASQSLMTHTDSLTGGSTPAVAITRITAGAAGTEVTGGAYARQAVTFSAPAGGTTSNSGTITFPTATANWGTLVAWGILDALTVGNLLFVGSLAGTNEVQTTTAGGTWGTTTTFTLSFGGQTTVALTSSATAGQVEEALEALSSIGEGNVSVSGGPQSTTAANAYPFVITFLGTLGGAAQSLITTSVTAGNGTTPTLTIAETIQGATGNKTINNGDNFSFSATKIAIALG